MPKQIRVAFGIDVDAVAGWLGSYGGQDSPDDISRGMFAGEVGAPRLLKLFEKYGIRTTWFVPGHSIETFPGLAKSIVAHGHEIGLHGYSHENPIAMTPTQERDVLDRCIELIENTAGVRPSGSVAPWWEFSTVTAELLLERGIKYDHSLMHNDFSPYYVRVKDSWTNIDYDLPAAEWMKPLVRGETTRLVEIPANWYLDDLPPMMFIKASPNSHGFVSPRHLGEMWQDQFDWVYREMDYGVYTMTIHPDVSGRPQTLLMLERLIEHFNGHEGVAWSTFDEIADDFIARNPHVASTRELAGVYMLIKNSLVLDLTTTDPRGATASDIRITGSRITELGANLTPAVEETVVDAAGKLVAPGFVNAHLHSQEALYKGRYDNLPLELWMLYAYPILGALKLPPELVYLRTMLVGLESIRNGVTTVVDDVIEMPFQDRGQLEAVFRAYDDLGLRANVSGHIMNRPFIDTLPFGREMVPAELARRVDDAPLIATKEYLDYSREAFARFHQPNGRLRYMLAPSGPQRCTDDLLAGAADLAREYDTALHIHVVETKMQAETARLMYGQTMAEHLAAVGALDRHTTFAHGVWLTEGDIALLGSTGASVAHNPLANLKLGAGVAPYRMLLEAGVTVGLGSDGLCNGSARLLDVVRLAALLHNVGTPDYNQWPTTTEILTSATLGGARSTLVDQTTGSIEVGKAADLVIYDLAKIPFTPLNDLRNHLVYSEDGSSIETVIVDGRVVLREGKVQTVDEVALLAEFREQAPAILAKHVNVEHDNAQFHAPVTEIHKWASAQPAEVNRYTRGRQAWAPYGQDSAVFRV